MKIDKERIPLPPRARTSKYSLGSIPLGGSATFTNDEITRHKLECVMDYCRTTYNEIYSYRTIEGGFRVWRLS